MYGCAYMGNESLLSTAPLFHLWLERPERSSGHGHCDNTRNMDHFMFECLSKHDRPTNKDESEMGWQYISLMEHTAESMQNKTKTRSHRCALYDVYDEDDRKIRIIRMVISKPVIGEEFNVSQCNGLSDLLARDLLPIIPEGHRYWPDGSLYIYLLGRKAKIFYTNTKKPEFLVINRPTTTTSRPSTTTITSRPSTTTSWPSTMTSQPSTTTTTQSPITTTTSATTEKYRHPSWFFFPNYYLHYV
ncbi:uncharacterized protein LOC132953610 [Metopolophium dirhodum]|uniref:uncharacterized protein LOC132953610 n=1 Tax=Metopolophium dirhodum TaxID=44670 RepID=UPI00298FC779|nr:uncharacterized protein LOC132953610 [Metopolophium dirhodum]